MARTTGRVRLVLLGLLGLAAFIVVAGLAIAQDQETIKLRSDIGVGDPRAMTFAASLVGAGVFEGNTYDVLTNGDQIFPAMLSAIDAATQRISLETYVYEEGSVAEQFTAALERAARRGVTVNVILDMIGAAGMDDAHQARLTAAGCTVLTLNAPSWYEIEEVNYRTHRKILVVDGEVGFTGGVGFADYWLGNAEHPGQWRDTHVRVRGPIVQRLEAAFYENFIEASEAPVMPVLAVSAAPYQVSGVRPISSQPGEPGAAPTTGEVAGAPVGAGESMLLRGEPTGGANDLKRLYLLAFAMARRSVEIATPYFATDESTLWAFEDAIHRGVRIRLLVESDVTDAKPVKYSSRAVYDRLLTMGVEIYEYQRTMMHAKVMVVDGVWSMFGSANFDNRSLELNDELNIVVSDPALAARFLRDFENDLRSSSRIDLAQWRARPRLDKTREGFWGYFEEVF